MPDRLSTLLHEVDDLPLSLSSPQRVRERGQSIRRRRRAAASVGALSLVAAAVLGASAVAGGGASTLEPPILGPAAPASEAPVAPSPQPVDEQPGEQPTGEQPPAPEPTEDTDGRVVDGLEMGFLRGFGDDGGTTVQVDRAVMLTGDEALAEAEKRGFELQSDFLLLNDNPRIREYPVSPDVRVTLTIGLAPPETQGGSVQSTLAELRERLQVPSGQDGELLDGYLFELVVKDGVVVSIDHQYLP